MQISKSLLVICASVICTGAFSVRGGDNPAQAKAREALEKALKEPPPQPPAPAPPPPAPAKPAETQSVAQPAPPPTPAAVPAPAPMPEVAAQPTPIATAVSPAPPNPETKAKLREALNKKLDELRAQEGQNNRDKAQAALRQAQDAARQNPQQYPPAQAPPNAANPQPPQVQAIPVSPAPPAMPSAPAPKASLKTAQAFPPIQGPDLPISAAKQQRLSELLSKYRADQITPEQYHVQRAKILAGP